MAKLIAHEVEVRPAVERECRKARHLMKRDAALDREILLISPHPPIDFAVDQLEEKSLSAYKRLVMRFYVAYNLLFAAFIR